MKLQDYLKTELEKKYLGKTIKNWDGSQTFVVFQIEVKHGGVDPQMEITFCSHFCLAMRGEARDWHTANNPNGGVPVPPELDSKWREGFGESYYLSQVDENLPEIIDAPVSLVGIDFSDSVVRISGSYSIPTPPKPIINIEESDEELDLARCEQCDEMAWDGYICHACGMKHI